MKCIKILEKKFGYVIYLPYRARTHTRVHARNLISTNADNNKVLISPYKHWAQGCFLVMTYRYLVLV